VKRYDDINRPRGYLFLILALALLFSLVMACAQPMAGQQTPSPPASVPTTQPSPVTESQPPEEMPPVAEAKDEEAWRVVETFTGKGKETTPPFQVSGTKWRITWAIDTEYPESAALNLVIYRQDAPYEIWQTVSHSGGNGGDIIYLIPPKGNRNFFIKVTARSLQKWTITVEDNAAVAYSSPVQITHIEYRGTVYPRDTKNCIGFERVEPDEYVAIKNLGDYYQDISGWVLKNITKGYPSFIFPPGLVLAPGQIIRVYTDEVYPKCETWQKFGARAPYCGQPTQLWFTFYFGPGDIWSNEKPDVAVLYNTQGEEVSRKSYVIPTENRVSENE
jgi:hypothetical protein